MSVKLSPKYGINPTRLQCYYCGQDTAGIALLGRLPDDKEAPPRMCINKEPCNNCKGYMAKGVIIIGVKGEPTPTEELIRSGHFLVMSEDWVNRVIIDDDLKKQILSTRCAFMPEGMADHLVNLAPKSY